MRGRQHPRLQAHTSPCPPPPLLHGHCDYFVYYYLALRRHPTHHYYYYDDDDTYGTSTSTAGFIICRGSGTCRPRPSQRLGMSPYHNARLPSLHQIKPTSTTGMLPQLLGLRNAAFLWRPPFWRTALASGADDGSCNSPSARPRPRPSSETMMVLETPAAFTVRFNLSTVAGVVNSCGVGSTIPYGGTAGLSSSGLFRRLGEDHEGYCSSSWGLRWAGLQCDSLLVRLPNTICSTPNNPKPPGNDSGQRNGVSPISHDAVEGLGCHFPD